MAKKIGRETHIKRMIEDDPSVSLGDDGRMRIGGMVQREDQHDGFFSRLWDEDYRPGQGRF